MQSVHIRMNLSLIPALKKILDPPMTVVVGYIPTLEVQPTLVVLAPLTLWACFFVELVFFLRLAGCLFCFRVAFNLPAGFLFCSICQKMHFVLVFQLNYPFCACFSIRIIKLFFHMYHLKPHFYSTGSDCCYLHFVVAHVKLV